MNPPKLEELEVVRTEHVGVMAIDVYAKDPDGNIWVCTTHRGFNTAWTLHKKAEDVVLPPPSFDQLVGN
jgi:hypothetical protein